MRGIVILGAGLLVACAAPDGPALGVVSATPASIEVWGNTPIPGGYLWNAPTYATDQQMTDLAQQHCQAYGKDAQKVSSSAVTGVRYILFHCI